MNFTEMNNKKILIIGLVWPEPTSSAAGTRMIQLINLFLSNGYEIVFACAAARTEFSFDLSSIGVTEREIELNSPGFNLFLQEINPSIVLFDRFIMEEQYGWRVHQECPDALKILDTEDLHCLRYARQQAVKEGRTINSADLFTDTAKREIASILRSDLSLIISEIEMKILQEQFQINPSLLHYLPFLEETLVNEDLNKQPDFEQREGFVFIGNFLHEPNWNTLQILKTKIWPILRKKLPTVSLHVYGAYSAQKVLQLHNERERFYIHGRAKDAKEVIANHRILLAPIQFGAGVKGKFIDAMQVGTPSVTTTIGAEAMKGDLEWNGAIADDLDIFTEQATKLYQDKEWWMQSQQNGIRIINKRYASSSFAPLLLQIIEKLLQNLSTHRAGNFFGQILHYHTLNSTKYMSLWIEEKKAKKSDLS